MGGRPAKPVYFSTGARTKSEVTARKKYETKIKGSGVPRPPKELTKEQKQIFKKIVDMLNESDILSQLDVYILTRTAVAIDSVNSIDAQIRVNKKLLLSPSVTTIRNKYMQEFFRCCNEIGLSPQSRAKMAISFSEKDKADELISILNGDDSNES